MEITLIDSRRSVVDAAFGIVPTICGDYFIECYKTERPVLMTASNPNFTMGGGIDAEFVRHFPELVRFKQYRGGGQERIANIVFAVTVDHSYKATKESVAEALRFAAANTDETETLCISGVGTGIGGLSLDDFADVLRDVFGTV